MPDDPSPDNESLEHLGDTVLSLVVTGLLREVYPCLRVGPSTSFVGGLYLDQGLEAAKAWLNPLLRPFLVLAYRTVRVQHGLTPEPSYAPQPPPYSEAASMPPTNGVIPYSSQTWSTPPPPRMPASIGHLSLFNQHLQQQLKSIEWVYSDSAGQGTRTTPIWVVRAMVDGECLGHGRGSTKKAARNEAAKEGLAKLGIAVP
ncbi:hypothetical protein TRAPUB_3832 [Trametes pubescens]|uniref:DRBM domain-containing protein n=1 Tax=Trametes pubescens TaxID=154538 RepID=A0A1M2VCL4_TRAPU|nr:hypothetical protein TRAPUB_3832 [Trametes pubescens]